MTNCSAAEVANPKHITCVFFSYAIDDNNKGFIQLLKNKLTVKH